MPWTKLNPGIPMRPGCAQAFMSCSSNTGGHRSEISLTIREGVEWFNPGAVVSVEVGSGDEAGLLKISPGGPFRVRPTTDNEIRKKKLPYVQIPLLDGMAPGRRRPVAVRITPADNCVLVDLPEWATAMVGPHSVPQPAVGAQPKAQEEVSTKAVAADNDAAKQAKPGKPANPWQPPGAFRGLGSTTPLPLPARRA